MCTNNNNNKCGLCTFLYVLMKIKYFNLPIMYVVFCHTTISLRSRTLFYIAHYENMEKELQRKIYERVGREFKVTEFKKFFYCPQVNYFKLVDILREQYPGCKLFFHVDHIVVRQAGSPLRVFILCAHISGKCAAFLHE